MPTAAIKSFAKKLGKSEAEIEKYWNEAKEAAEGEKAKGDDAFYGTAMKILKNKLKKHAGLSEGRMRFGEYLTEDSVNEADGDINFVDEFLEKGRAKEKNITEKDVDADELKMGIEVEYEHTSNPSISKRIALDHLAEIPDYYTRLKKMEDEGKKAMKDK